MGLGYLSGKCRDSERSGKVGCAVSVGFWVGLERMVGEKSGDWRGLILVWSFKVRARGFALDRDGVGVSIRRRTMFCRLSEREKWRLVVMVVISKCTDFRFTVSQT